MSSLKPTPFRCPELYFYQKVMLPCPAPTRIPDGDCVMPIVNLEAISLYYEEHGAGEPLLFLHGLGSDGRSWEYQRDVFAQQFRVILVDVRGHGRSAKPPGPYSVPQFAADIFSSACSSQYRRDSSCWAVDGRHDWLSDGRGSDRSGSKALLWSTARQS